MTETINQSVLSSGRIPLPMAQFPLGDKAGGGLSTLISAPRHEIGLVSVQGFWDKNTGICAGAMPYRRVFIGHYHDLGISS